MQKNVELRVDVINQLMLYRSSTFKDRMCFLDEDVQNAQRAKATEVRVNKVGNDLVISNNGGVLDDVQKLFSMAESGWDEEVTKNENPFGLGFFSNISVTNLIEVETGNTKVIFDVDEVIRTRDVTAIKTEEMEIPYEGFKLTLKNFSIKSGIYDYQVKERMELLGKYIHELDVYYNNQLMPKVDITGGDGNPDNYKIDSDGLKGWLRLSDGWSGKLDIFYKGRLVKTISELQGIVGDLHVTDKTLNLTAPDRKDIIRDKKYSDMMELLKLYIEELCLQYMEEKDEKSIDKYADTIERYVTVDKIMNRIRFLVFNGKNDGKLLDQVLRISKKERTDDFSTIEAYLKEGAEVQPESHFEQIDCVQRSKPVPHPDRSAHSYSGGGGSYTPATPIVSEKERMETQGLEYFGKKSAKFWVALSDLTEYEKKIDILKFYNLDLVMSRNALETKVLAHMEKQKKISHISTLEDTVTITSSLSNTELNKKEERALMLFEMVSRMCGFDRNIFAIGNLCVSRTFEIEGLDYKDEAVLDDVVAIRNYDVDKIYIDRSIVKTSGLRNDLFPILTLEDYKFILRNIDDLAEEISFMLKKSANTIREELIHALAGVK